MRELGPNEQKLIKCLDAIGWRVKRFLDRFLKVRSVVSTTNVKRILIFEPWNIGDFVIASNYLSLLKDQFPNARITMLCKPATKTIALRCRYIDEVIPFIFPWTEARGTYRIFNRLKPVLFLIINIRKRKFDLAISGRPDPRHNLFLWLFGAKRRIGFGTRGGGFLLTNSLGGEVASRNAYERWAGIMHAAGGTGEPMPGIFQFSSFEIMKARDLITSNGVREGDIIIGIHTGASDFSKAWPRDRFEEVIKEIVKIPNIRVFLISPPESAKKNFVCDATVVLPTVNLQILGCLLKEFDMLLCNDSGQMHLAAAVGTPVVALFGVTDPEEWKPIGLNHILLESPLKGYRNSYLNYRYEHPKSWLSISIQEVVKAVKIQINRAKAQKSQKQFLGNESIRLNPKLRILILHNSYQYKGGEDAVVARETALLRECGHKVHLHSVSNDSIQSFLSNVTTAWQTPYSHWSRREILRIIEGFAPDVVHVHNFFPQFSPSIYDACRDAGVAVVQTLHNYRTICAGALLMREGKPCDDCIQGTPYQAVLHGCYRDSRLASLAVARMIDVHRRGSTWAKKVDRFIALTDFAKNKFVEADFPAAKITVKPNFVEVAEPAGTLVDAERKGALFVGRLSQEKGIETLLRAWESVDFPLRILGDGPLMDRVRGQALGTIAVLGIKNPKQVNEEMARAAFLVVPSEYVGTFGLQIIEAFAQGLPVITSALGARMEMVENNVTGLYFTTGDAEDLAKKVRWASEHPEELRRMGQNARRVYEEKYTSDINYRQLIAIYEEAIEERLLKGDP